MRASTGHRLPRHPTWFAFGRRNANNVSSKGAGLVSPTPNLYRYFAAVMNCENDSHQITTLV